VKSLGGNHNSLLLEPVWIVGFTGHRHLQAPDKIKQVIGDTLVSLRAEIPGRVVGYSSVAIGADTLFAEEWLSSGLPWIALLPRAEKDFKNDFTECDWARTHRLIQKASRVQSLSGIKEAEHELAYLECGLRVVDEADIMVAVWDGKPSRGVGGTADIVANARNLSKPLILIEPQSLEVSREHFSPELFADPEMSYLNEIAAQAAPPLKERTDPEERVRRFFKKVDAKAASLAPRFRLWVAASVIMNAAAAILVAAAIAFQVSSLVLNALIFLLTTAAAVAVFLIKRKRAHQKWIRCRVASEICRSALATWNLADVAEPAWFNHLTEFVRLVKTIRLMKLTSQSRKVTDLGEWRQHYLATRVDEQIHYFRRRRKEFGLALAVLSGSFWAFSFLGIARFLLVGSAFGIGPLLPVTPSNAFAWHFVQAFFPIALPLAAGCTLSLISIFDINRQLARSKAMEALLIKLCEQIQKTDHLPGLRRAVENVENALASEVFEWFTLFRYPRFN
jgi:hypothetical protein